MDYYNPMPKQNDETSEVKKDEDCLENGQKDRNLDESYHSEDSESTDKNQKGRSVSESSSSKSLTGDDEGVEIKSTIDEHEIIDFAGSEEAKKIEEKVEIGVEKEPIIQDGHSSSNSERIEKLRKVFGENIDLKDLQNDQNNAENEFVVSSNFEPTKRTFLKQLSDHLLNGFYWVFAFFFTTFLLFFYLFDEVLTILFLSHYRVQRPEMEPNNDL